MYGLQQLILNHTLAALSDTGYAKMSVEYVLRLVSVISSVDRDPGSL